MQQVQLYIEDKRVEMFDFESVSITDSIKNVKDVVSPACTPKLRVPVCLSHVQVIIELIARIIYLAC